MKRTRLTGEAERTDPVSRTKNQRLEVKADRTAEGLGEPGDTDTVLQGDQHYVIRTALDGPILHTDF